MPIYDAPGSPPGKLSPFDWQSILWTLFTAAIAAVLTALVDSVLPDLKERGLIDAALFTLLTTGLHALRKFALDTRVLTLLVAVVMLGCGGAATADDVTVRLKGLVRGQSYELVYDASGAVSLRIIPAVVVDGPSPTPTPSPDPTLSVRGVAIRDAALKATTDTKRSETAVMLAMLYGEIGKKVATGELPLDKVAAVLTEGANRMLGLQGAPPDSWKAMREQLSTFLAPALQEGSESTAKLLTETAAGLEASATNFQAGAIDRDKLRQLILQIILLIIAGL